MIEAQNLIIEIRKLIVEASVLFYVSFPAADLE